MIDKTFALVEPGGTNQFKLKKKKDLVEGPFSSL